MLIGRSTIGTVAYLGGILAIPEPFVKAWGDMIQYNSEYLVGATERILYTRSTVSYHAFARNSLVEQMKGDWLFMLDTDILFEPDILARMLHKMNKYDVKVLAGMYPYKSYPHAPVMYGKDPKKKKTFVLGDWDRTIEIMQIHSAGAGCLLIHKSVIEKIQETKEQPFDIVEPFSEDISFFRRLEKLGIKAYTAPDIELKHLTYKELSVQKDYPKDDMLIGKRIEVDGYK